MSADTKTENREIALLSPGWPPGRVANGIVTYVGHLRDALARQQRKAYVITGNTTGDNSNPPAVCLDNLAYTRRQQILERALQRFPGVEPSGVTLALQLFAGLMELQKRHPVALLEMEETFGAAGYLKHFINIPVVVRLHGPWFLNGAALGVPQDESFHRRDAAERLCIRDAVGVTSPSRDVLEEVRRHYKVELAEAVVIPNASPKIPAQQQWTPATTDNNTILFVGRFDRHKGGDTMIDAFAIIAQACPDAKLMFVGPDNGVSTPFSSHVSIRDYIQTKLPGPIQARVDVRGPMQSQDIEPLRRQARVTVIASRYENFGLALVEALAFGCPTVASRAGGSPEIVQDGKTGVLFAPGDSDDLAAKVIALYEDPARSAAYGLAAAHDMATRLDPDRIAEDTWAYYETVWERFRPQKRKAPLRLLTQLFRLA